MIENFKDKLIFSRHVDGSTEREDGVSRDEARKHQAQPLIELNNPDQMRRIEKPFAVNGNSTKPYIESIKAGKLQNSE
ncbi:hypothetical protein IID22_02500 [Patescibacteria group bacterium]|nr:hypothetical protein [Patescibacteria group bacterium]